MGVKWAFTRYLVLRIEFWVKVSLPSSIHHWDGCDLHNVNNASIHFTMIVTYISKFGLGALGNLTRSFGYSNWCIKGYSMLFWHSSLIIGNR